MRKLIEITEYFIDTNILWWYFVANSKNHEKIKNFLDNLIRIPENSFVVNEFVMIELFHLLIKKVGKKGYKLAHKLLNNNFTFFKIKYNIHQLNDLKDILSIFRVYGYKTSIGSRDSSILHSMNIQSVNNIISNDLGFKQVVDIIFHNPLS